MQTHGSANHHNKLFEFACGLLFGVSRSQTAKVVGAPTKGIIAVNPRRYIASLFAVIAVRSWGKRFRRFPRWQCPLPFHRHLSRRLANARS